MHPELRRHGEVLASFDGRASGHASFGVVGGRGQRWFVKTWFVGELLRAPAERGDEATEASS